LNLLRNLGFYHTMIWAKQPVDFLR
jgi:hypothetical protein